MKFVDEAVISVQAGKGGAGARHFRREKFVAYGGPDGGNGGHGGSVILEADTGMHTLLDFKYRAEWSAGDGQSGGGSNKDGKAGEDTIIRLPVGTEVFRLTSEDPDGQRELVCDLTAPGARFVLADGGRGGRGNTFFKTSTNQAPEYAQPGEQGTAGQYLLSLKLVADVGLIGMPNAGKSTLISRISAAKPKIADYPFTTLVPNLGVVAAKGGRSFVVADIPGLIPGASEGKGLGIRFLKHVERTRVLAHLVDVSLAESAEQLYDVYLAITRELQAFSDELAERPEIIILTKVDAVPDKELVQSYVDCFAQRGKTAYAISSSSGQGIPDLIETLANYVF